MWKRICKFFSENRSQFERELPSMPVEKLLTERDHLRAVSARVEDWHDMTPRSRQILQLIEAELKNRNVPVSS